VYQVYAITGKIFVMGRFYFWRVVSDLEKYILP